MQAQRIDGMQLALGLRVLLQRFPDDIVEQQHLGSRHLLGLNTCGRCLRNLIAVLRKRDERRQEQQDREDPLRFHGILPWSEKMRTTSRLA